MGFFDNIGKMAGEIGLFGGGQDHGGGGGGGGGMFGGISKAVGGLFGGGMGPLMGEIGLGMPGLGGGMHMPHLPSDFLPHIDPGIAGEMMPLGGLPSIGLPSDFLPSMPSFDPTMAGEIGLF